MLHPRQQTRQHWPVILESGFTHPIDVILPGVLQSVMPPRDEILMGFLREVNGE